MAPSGEHDSSVRAPEAQRPVIILIAFFGFASVLFCIAAELSRVRTYRFYEVEGGLMECIYPPSVSLWYAVAGAASLVLTQAAGFVCAGFTWCPNRNNSSILSNTKTSVGVVFVAQLIFSVAAIGTLLGGGIRNSSLPKTPQYVTPNHPTCELVDEGIFLTAATLSLFSGILVEAYYVMSMRVKREQWFDAYSAGPVDGIELLDRDTEILRVPGATGPAEAQEDDDDDLETAFGRSAKDDDSDHEIWRRDEKFRHIPKP